MTLPPGLRCRHAYKNLWQSRARQRCVYAIFIFMYYESMRKGGQSATAPTTQPARMGNNSKYKGCALKQKDNNNFSQHAWRGWLLGRIIEGKRGRFLGKESKWFCGRSIGADYEWDSRLASYGNLWGKKNRSRHSPASRAIKIAWKWDKKCDQLFCHWLIWAG